MDDFPEELAFEYSFEILSKAKKIMILFLCLQMKKQLSPRQAENFFLPFQWVNLTPL